MPLVSYSTFAEAQFDLKLYSAITSKQMPLALMRMHLAFHFIFTSTLRALPSAALNLKGNHSYKASVADFKSLNSPSRIFN